MFSLFLFWSTQIVGLERLCFEFVQKSNEAALVGFYDGCTVLPYSVFRIVPSTNGITLILVNVVDAQTRIEGLAKDIKPYPLGNCGFKVGQCLKARAALPWRVPS